MDVLGCKVASLRQAPQRLGGVIVLDKNQNGQDEYQNGDVQPACHPAREQAGGPQKIHEQNLPWDC